MTDAEERAWVDECCEAARVTSTEGLYGLFQSAMSMVIFAAQVGGEVDVSDKASIEFTVLRTELELRGLVCFH